MNTIINGQKCYVMFNNRIFEARLIRDKDKRGKYTVNLAPRPNKQFNISSEKVYFNIKEIEKSIATYCN